MPTRVPMATLRLRLINIALLLRATLAAWGGDPLAQNIACYTTEVDETFIDFDGELNPSQHSLASPLSKLLHLTYWPHLGPQVLRGKSV